MRFIGWETELIALYGHFESFSGCRTDEIDARTRYELGLTISQD
jgi:hypothetical protein